MKEAGEFWADKVRLSPGQFGQLSSEARLRAFAVSGIAKGAELETVFNALQKSINEGISYGDFRKDCRAIFEKRGWTGKRAWRMDNIFRTNIQTAYNVGRYAQMKAVAKSRPYWKYSAVNDSRTRPVHAALDGRIFPADHEFWDTWMPPNGYMCRCSVVTLSERQVRDRGLKVEKEDPTNGLIEPVDPKTGNRMPARPLIPDPGWAHNPGKSVFGGIVESALQEGGKLSQFPDLKGHSDYRLPSAREIKNLPSLPKLLPSVGDMKAKGMSNKAISNYYSDAFREAFGIEKSGSKAFEINRDIVIVSEKLITGKGGRIKITKGDRGQYIPVYKDTLTDPDEIWLTPMKDDSGRVILRRRYLKFWRGEKDNVGGFCVLDAEKGVWTGVTIYDVEGKQTDSEGRNQLDDPGVGYRRGILLHRKGKGR